MESNHVTEVKEGLKAMGFSQELVDKSYEAAPIKTVEGIIIYIEQNQDNSNADTVGQTGGSEKPEGDMVQEGAQAEEKPVEPQGEPISAHVNAQFRDQLLQLGFEKDPAEKALFMTQSKSVEGALDWLEQNKNAPDFKEPLFIVRPSNADGTPAPVSNLTPEEAKAAAKELQEKARKIRAEKDKVLEEQREKDRLRIGKDMTEARRKMDEQKLQIRIDTIKRDKEEKERAMAKVMAEIEKDRYDRTGKKSKVMKPADEVFRDIFKKMVKVYPLSGNTKPILKKCLATISIYLGTFNFKKFEFLTNLYQATLSKIPQTPNFWRSTQRIRHLRIELEGLSEEKCY